MGLNGWYDGAPRAATVLDLAAYAEYQADEWQWEVGGYRVDAVKAALTNWAGVFMHTPRKYMPTALQCLRVDVEAAVSRLTGEDRRLAELLMASEDYTDELRAAWAAALAPTLARAMNGD